MSKLLRKWKGKLKVKLYTVAIFITFLFLSLTNELLARKSKEKKKSLSWVYAPMFRQPTIKLCIYNTEETEHLLSHKNLLAYVNSLLGWMFLVQYVY